MRANPDDFDMFYAGSVRRVTSYLCVVTGSRAEAEDAAQEAYARAWQRWDQVSKYGDPEGWVRTVAYRVSVSTWRKAMNRAAAHRRGDRRRRRRTAASAALASVLVLSGGGAAWALTHSSHPIPAPRPPAVSISPLPRATHSGAPHPHASAPGASQPSPPPTSSPPASTKTLQLGPLPLQVPLTWRVTYRDAEAGYYAVSTGACANDSADEAWDGSPCPAFSLITGAGPTTRYPTPTPGNYTPWGQYLPTGGSPGACPGKPFPAWRRTGSAGAKPFDQGYVPVSTTKTADYVV